MKTSELAGAALDWAVAKCEGIDVVKGKYGITYPTGHAFNPSTVWDQGGPIIEREGINTVKMHGFGWHADCGKVATGPTPLIAAMRCYVASKLGNDVINIPKALV
jgi:hypothetical protein